MKIQGEVIKGRKIGRTLGYPTANIAPDGEAGAALADTPSGVYAARVSYGGKSYGAMANLGVKPTFAGLDERVLELHLFDFTGDLYGENLEVELTEFIRSERRFTSLEELRDQIGKDEKTIRLILEES
jgi:riboflavin kinase/FMN adenylyltransferase